MGVVSAMQSGVVELNYDSFEGLLWPNTWECLDIMPVETLRTVLKMAEHVEAYEECAVIAEELETREDFDVIKLFKIKSIKTK
jgi:hypothetical protein